MRICLKKRVSRFKHIILYNKKKINFFNSLLFTVVCEILNCIIMFSAEVLYWIGRLEDESTVYTCNFVITYIDDFYFCFFFPNKTLICYIIVETYNGQNYSSIVFKFKYTVFSTRHAIYYIHWLT